jgi:chemotaxis family two-component system response regulator Rcp1
VDNEPADLLLLRRAIKASNHPTNVYALHDGEGALAFLRGKGSLRHFPRPDIILMDLCLPKRGGHSLLKEIKRDRSLQDIPVIIITNSVSISEVRAVYRHFAAGYINKTFDYNLLKRRIATLVAYWGKTIMLPSKVW